MITIINKNFKPDKFQHQHWMFTELIDNPEEIFFRTTEFEET